ncbi:hypothetical protein C8F01DRAFT_1245754 [Mycena amicta]|nr:hypothetical protein C8F01DRAFT_1245754 [Mycena amicta]
MPYKKSNPLEAYVRGHHPPYMVLYGEQRWAEWWYHARVAHRREMVVSRKWPISTPMPPHWTEVLADKRLQLKLNCQIDIWTNKEFGPPLARCHAPGDGSASSALTGINAETLPALTFSTPLYRCSKPTHIVSLRRRYKSLLGLSWHSR